MYLVIEPVPSKDGLSCWMTRVMARQLLLVRHAGIAPRDTGRYVGSTEVPLEPQGLQQAKALGELVRSKRPERCFSSPLIRARQTAQVICQLAGLLVEVDKDLREVDFGQWEGKTFDEIAAENPEAVNHWADFSDDFTFPDGESVESFLTRIHQAADRLAADPADVVLAVTHGGVIRGMLCYLLGLHARHYLAFNIQHATCTTVDLLNGRGILSGLNEQCVSERI
jgi:alpha-ribazole phosphatase